MSCLRRSCCLSVACCEHHVGRSHQCAQMVVKALGQLRVKRSLGVNLLQYLCLLSLFLTQTLAHTPEVPPPATQCHEEQGIHSLCPHTEIPRRQDMNVETIDFVGRTTIAVKRSYFQAIIAVWQSVVGNVSILGIQCCPSLVVSFKAIDIECRGVVGKRNVCQTKRHGTLTVAQRDAAGIGQIAARRIVEPAIDVECCQRNRFLYRESCQTGSIDAIKAIAASQTDHTVAGTVVCGKHIG